MAGRSVTPEVLLPTLLKNRCNVSLFSVTWALYLTAMSFQMTWKVAWQLYQPISQDSGVHLVRSHRLGYIQGSRVITNLTFSYSVSYFAFSVPVLWSVY